MSKINEQKLPNYPSPIFLEGSKKIINQMEKSVCRIFAKNGSKATGFFCKIPLSLNQYLRVFITNNHVLNEEYLEKENEIKISLKDDENIRTINLRNKLKYTNKEHDITIISLNNNECENIFEFLELDDNILKNDGSIYIGNSIYILHYPDNFGGNKVAVSYGILKNRFEDKIYDFIHLCSTENGSSGSPILNISNNKIIGIHKQGIKSKEYNIGAFLCNSIKEYISLYNNFKLEKIFNDKSKIEELIRFLKFNEEVKFLISLGARYRSNEPIDTPEKINNRINLIYSIFNQGLISNIIPIKYKGEIIAQKLFLTNHTSVPNTWTPAWHGTKIENLESIIKFGLKPQGTKLPNGKFVPKTKYLPFKQYILGIENWENAIFATPCPICASIYSSFYYAEYNMCTGYLYSPSLIEIRIKPGCFTQHLSKEIIGNVGEHCYLKVFHNDVYYRIPFDKNIVIKSITFIDRIFLYTILGHDADYPENTRDNYNEVTVKPGKELQELLNNLFS
mgnify:CR=1 FL=1